MQITPDNTAGFLQYFYSFQDGVIRRFEYTYRHTRGAHARVTVSTQHIPEIPPPYAEVHEEWCNVVLDFEDVTEFVWAEGGEVFQQVFLFDLHIRHWNNQAFVDFGWLENGIADKLTTAENGLDTFRKSKVYIAARSITWTRLPYKEL